MHRRITTVVPYAAPDYGMRLRIWSSLLSTVARPASEQPDGRLRMADDVDVASLAVKYELTGGFIKNAILTAVLCALSREREGGGYTGEDQSYYAHNRSLDDAVNLTIGAAKLEKAVTIGGHSAVDSAVLRQADLIAGCRLQMRGAMNISPFEDRLIPDRCGMSCLSLMGCGSCRILIRGLEELHLSPAVREAGKVVVRFEKARARVYGTWAGWAPNILGGSQLAGALSRQAAAQKCCLCAIAGPTGYGKRTFIRGVCYDLGRPLKMVHASSVLGGSTNGSMAEVGISPNVSENSVLLTSNVYNRFYMRSKSYYGMLVWLMLLLLWMDSSMCCWRRVLQAVGMEEDSMFCYLGC